MHEFSTMFDEADGDPAPSYGEPSVEDLQELLSSAAYNEPWPSEAVELAEAA